MESPSSPENLSEDDLRPWFRSGETIQRQNANEEARRFLQSRDLICVDEEHYVHCVNENDGDYWDLESRQRDCIGKIPFEPGEERVKEYTCPECGRNVGTVQEKTLRGETHKTHFTEYRVSPDWEGIWKYVRGEIASLDVVSRVQELSSQTIHGRYSREVDLQNGRGLQLVLADIAEAEALYKGAYFASPTLYVRVDPNVRRKHTVLEDLQLMDIEAFATASEEALTQAIEDAATPVEGFTNYQELDTALERQLEAGAEEEDTDEWNYLEQKLMPRLTSYLVQHPSATDAYLKRLRKVRNTMLEQHHVPIGGAGNPDMLPVPKFPLMKQFVENASVGEAKRYTEGKSSFDVGDLGKHLRHIRKTSGVEQGVVFLTSNRVPGNVWEEVIGDCHDKGRFRALILTRYLLLELIDGVGAHELLGVDRREDGSLKSME